MFSLYLYLNFFPCIEIKHDKARGQDSSCPLSLLSWIYYYSNHFRTRRTRFSTGQVLMHFISLSWDSILLCSPGGWPQNWQCFRSRLSHAGSTWNCVLSLDFSSVCVCGGVYMEAKGFRSLWSWSYRQLWGTGQYFRSLARSALSNLCNPWIPLLKWVPGARALG